MRSSKISRAGRLARVSAVLVVLYTLGILNYLVPAVRFISPLANTVTFSVLQLIPFTLLAFALVAGPLWARVLWCVVLLPVAAFAGLLGSCTALDATLIAANGRDPSVEQLEVVRAPAGRLVIYRKNYGAVSDFSISVRQECRLLPGLLRVREIWRAAPASEVRTQVLAGDRVKFVSPAYGDRRPDEIIEEVRLKPLWCPGAD